MSAAEYTHVTFSDESNWNAGRYRAIGMVSAPRTDALSLHYELKQLFVESQVQELKWHKLRTAKHRFASVKAIDSCAKALASNRMRIDVLSWDSQDHRHAIKDPDLEANLQIMYYHLFRNVMSRRWPSNAVWRHIPDEHTGVDWKSVQKFLSIKDTQIVSELEDPSSPEPIERFAARLKTVFRVHEITECKSQEMCLTQAADLFAGLAAFSRENHNSYKSWKDNSGYSSTLFDEQPETKSGGLSEKYQVLAHLEAKIRQLALPISLESSGGLRTRDPRIPLNFWWYEPRSIHDKARSKKSN